MSCTCWRGPMGAGPGKTTAAKVAMLGCRGVPFLAGADDQAPTYKHRKVIVHLRVRPRCRLCCRCCCLPRRRPHIDAVNVAARVAQAGQLIPTRLLIHILDDLLLPQGRRHGCPLPLPPPGPAAAAGEAEGRRGGRMKRLLGRRQRQQAAAGHRGLVCSRTRIGRFVITSKQPSSKTRWAGTPMGEQRGEHISEFAVRRANPRLQPCFDAAAH